MTARATSLNPAILRWARERSGFSIEAAAERISKPPELLSAWESGDAAPTFRQLQDIAQRVYKRPVALFFFSVPPDEPDLSGEFRMLPEERIRQLEPDTRLAIREAHALRLSIYELTGGRTLSERNIISDFSTGNLFSNPEALARDVREYLAVTLQEQRSWRDNRQALWEWRDRVEACGVYVFKRSFSQRSISGFCLHDETFPLIMINNSSAQARQIFTLLHELGHLLKGVSSVTPINNWDIHDLPPDAQQVEIFCNSFAGELLLPSEALPPRPHSLDPGSFSTQVARTFNVSREVVLRKLYDRGIVDSHTYRELVETWNSEYQVYASSRTGGHYYANQKTYLGNAYLDLVFTRYRLGAIESGDAARHLRIKASSLTNFENYLETTR